MVLKNLFFLITNPDMVWWCPKSRETLWRGMSYLIIRLYGFQADLNWPDGSLSTNDCFQEVFRAATMSGNGNAAALHASSPQLMLYRCSPMPREYISCEENSSSEKNIQKLRIPYPKSSIKCILYPS
jgi:hypothetical protein